MCIALFLCKLCIIYETSAALHSTRMKSTMSKMNDCCWMTLVAKCSSFSLWKHLLSDAFSWKLGEWREKAKKANIIMHYTVYWINIIYWMDLIANANLKAQREANSFWSWKASNKHLKSLELKFDFIEFYEQVLLFNFLLMIFKLFLNFC
jgi:hypothetical protein